MASTATLGGTSLTNGAPFTMLEPFSTGGNDLAQTLLTGDLKMEEYDQYLAEIRYTRRVEVPLSIRSSSLAASITDVQTLNQKLAAANRSSPVDFVFTPNGGNASTFKVIGGAVEADYTRQQDNSGIIRNAVLHLEALPWVYGASQNLGSAGTALTTNTASPATATLSPSPTGDVPGDVTLFVKNRSASAIRSLMVGGISSNTTWTAASAAPAWTPDANGTLAAGTYIACSASDATTVRLAAHFTAPTLPSDRRFRLYLRAAFATVGTYAPSVRVRVVSGQAEVIGGWRSASIEQVVGVGWTVGLDMGAFTFPVGDVGALGAQSTTVYIEVRGNETPLSSSYIYSALFMPDDSSVIVETADTGKTLAAAAGVTRVESDQAYDSSGNPAGGAMVGAHIRTLGGRYTVYASQGYLGSLDPGSLPWAPENVDIYASFVPRYIHLA